MNQVDAMRQISEVVDLRQALARRVEELSTMQRINRELNTAPDFDRVMDMMMEWALRGTGAPVGAIALHDSSRQGLLLLSAQGYPPEFERYRDEPWPLGDGIVGRVVRSGESALVADVRRDPDYHPVQPTTLSQLSVPIRREDQVVGVVNLESPEQDAFDKEDLAFVQRLADHAAIAIENARLHRECQQRAEQMALLFETSAAVSRSLDLDKVLQTIARQITDALAIDGCSIYMWEHTQDTLVNLLDYSEDPEWREPEAPGTAYQLADYPLTRQVLVHRQPLALRASEPGSDPTEVGWMKSEEVQSLLMVPMIVRDEAIGLLELMQAHGEREFTPTEIALCQTLANQAAAALENAHLFERVKAANQAKSEFIDFVAHELKQPMTAMQGYTRMLSLGIGGELSATHQQFVEIINSNVGRMGKLVNDLLEISRLEAGRTQLKLAPVYLQEVVDETIANARTEIEARHHRLEVDTPPDLPPVMGDRERLIQILTNLVSNATRYTPEGGTIRIVVNGRDYPEPEAGYLCVSVSDTGIGMSPQDLENLKEKFFRADRDLVQQQPGTGLGVSISRSLVELHGGELMVESELDKGSVFRFTMPIAAEQEE